MNISLLFSQSELLLLLLLLFSSLIVVASSLIAVAWVGILVLFLILGEMLSDFLHWEYCLLWVYHIWPFLCWHRFLLCQCFEDFYHKCALNLSKHFSVYTEMSIWFLSFSLLIWCIMLIDLHILKNPCIPEINPTWSWCMCCSSFDVLLNSVC